MSSSSSSSPPREGELVPAAKAFIAELRADLLCCAVLPLDTLIQEQLAAQTQYPFEPKRQPLLCQDSFDRWVEAAQIRGLIKDKAVADRLLTQLFSVSSKAQLPYFRKKRAAQVKREATVAQACAQVRTTAVIDAEIAAITDMVKHLSTEVTRKLQERSRIASSLP